ncbi:LysR family transcriptional regulator [Caballeronia sp. J97]|uniref:LysR family transcriptional regulator n=1 Tax=Caballeronia sp. J97 TaxID=2805429 RepID=UPI002AB149EE|nr:LysR family transcriptional regulator [Caballeronia sp. J97]
MSALSYSLAQIEAFASVAEHGTITRAAQHLAKDRSTVSELVEFLETDLGFALFTRAGRSLALTPEGKRLQRQARLLLRQAQAFGAAARNIPNEITDEIGIVYDPFVPRPYVHALIDRLASLGIRVSAWSGTRQEAEAALVAGTAQLAISLARNQSVRADLEWRAVGSIEMAIYASTDLFASGDAPITMLELSSRPQIVMHRTLDEQFARQVQISDRVIFANELDTVRHLLRKAHGWGFLPTHFDADRWPGVQAIDTEVGRNGLTHTMVAVWRPGAGSRATIADTLDVLAGLWKDVMP